MGQHGLLNEALSWSVSSQARIRQEWTTVFPLHTRGYVNYAAADVRVFFITRATVCRWRTFVSELVFQD